jgi:hypothetical protein
MGQSLNIIYEEHKRSIKTNMEELILTTHILNCGYQYDQMKNIMNVSKHTKKGY